MDDGLRDKLYIIQKQTNFYITPYKCLSLIFNRSLKFSQVMYYLSVKRVALSYIGQRSLN